MTDKKKRKRQTGKPRDRKELRRRPHEARQGNTFVDATHQVVEDEVRKGDAPAATDPDQKGEPGSRI
jgi:hypothetical protein